MSQVKPTPIAPKVVKVVRKRKRLRPVSTKRAKENVAYRALKKLWHKVNPFCEVPRCYQPSMEEPHHKRGREGWRLCDVPYWMAVCLEHHRMIHDNPDWAYREGYCISRVPTPKPVDNSTPQARLIQEKENDL